jgi:phosphoribosyl 1,2-cyclic phosphodiesterase
MSLRVCMLGSSSSGNCTYVASERTRILIDAGLSYRETARRLETIQADVSRVTALCLTHEHSDHTGSLQALHRRVGLALYANSGTIQAVEQGGKTGPLPWNVFTTGMPFRIGDLDVEPFSVPHDSYDPVGFVIGCGAARVGVVTDMGMVTGLIRERLRRCQAVVVESNHDEKLLRDADRPWSLKQRIAGRQGHLSNEQAAELLAELAADTLRVVLLAHLSADCNRPELAMKTVRRVLEAKGRGHVDVKLTYPDQPSDVVDV